MVNTELFNKTIKDLGIKKCFVAKKIGITHQAFSNKVNNHTEFTIAEVQEIRKTISIPDEMFMRIFFNKNVDDLEAKGTTA